MVSGIMLLYDMVGKVQRVCHSRSPLVWKTGWPGAVEGNHFDSLLEHNAGFRTLLEARLNENSVSSEEALKQL